MGLPVTAKQDEVSGIPIPKLRAFYEAIGDGPVVLDLEGRTSSGRAGAPGPPATSGRSASWATARPPPAITA